MEAIMKSSEFLSRATGGCTYPNLPDIVKSHDIIDIQCNKHGLFSQRVYAHLQGAICPKCANEKRGKKKTTDEFLNQVKGTWENIDYSETVYVDKETKIKFKCLIHGEFYQKPNLHIKHGCPYCNGRGESKHTKETFIKKATEVHGDLYGYDKVEINGINNHILIYCKVHKEYFKQKASDHINGGRGCPKCNGGVKLTNEEFLEKSKQVHGEGKFLFKYPYTRSHDKIEIECTKHGKFEQFAYMHLQTIYSCPICAADIHESSLEREILDYIKTIYQGEVIQHNQDTIGMEIDIYFPELKLGFEVHGNYWHVEQRVGRNLHYKKWWKAEENGIKLIQIFETEWRDKQDIIKSIISNLLNKNKKIYAKNCQIVNFGKDIKNSFLELNHLQGRDNSSICYGLYYNDEIVACMTFGNPRFNKEYNYELIRYCSLLFTNVVGGAGKLLKHFKDNHLGSIVSFANKRYSSGKLYERLGFKFIGHTPISYFYYHIGNKTIHSRYAFMKKKQPHKLKTFCNKLSEYDNMLLNGYDRIWDCGNYKFAIE